MTEYFRLVMVATMDIFDEDELYSLNFEVY